MTAAIMQFGALHDPTDALDPARAAEQQPPHEDRQRADDTPKHSDGYFGIGRNNRGAEHDEQLDDGDRDSGPQPQGFSWTQFVGVIHGHREARIANAVA